MNLKRILFCLTAFAAAIATSVPCAARRPSGSDLRLLYWNIQNGMWSGQDDNYGRFVEWVKEFDADVCVWCEAQSIYRSGTADRMPEADRYLVGNWGELAARYGHKYWYVGGHRDNFPQVITSKYPIENVERIVGEEPDSVVTHGAGWARIAKNGRTVNIVTRICGRRLTPTGRPTWRRAATRTRATVTAAWRSSISAGIRSAPLPAPPKSFG